MRGMAMQRQGCAVRGARTGRDSTGASLPRAPCEPSIRHSPPTAHLPSIAQRRSDPARRLGQSTWGLVDCLETPAAATDQERAGDPIAGRQLQVVPARDRSFSCSAEFARQPPRHRELGANAETGREAAFSTVSSRSSSRQRRPPRDPVTSCRSATRGAPAHRPRPRAKAVRDAQSVAREMPVNGLREYVIGNLAGRSRGLGKRPRHGYRSRHCAVP
jgi:hypothetical protein